MQSEASGGSKQDGRKPQTSDWRTRIIVGDQLGVEDPPAWMAQSYKTLYDIVIDPRYPCFFGTQAERRGEMFYSYVQGKDISGMAATMATFARLADEPAYRKHNIAVFFEPDAEPLSHQAYHDHFWRTLQHLHDVDPDPEADYQPDPHDEAWEFSFAGLQTFVVCACPSFETRHSRNLGPGMVLLFQPRAVFVDTITNKVIGREARNQVRARLREWDAVEPHPDLGFYGDPGNLEWKQYFLSDENVAAIDKCPFLNRRHATLQQRSAMAEKPPSNAPIVAADVLGATPPSGGVLTPEQRIAAMNVARGVSGASEPFSLSRDGSRRFDGDVSRESTPRHESATRAHDERDG